MLNIADQSITITQRLRLLLGFLCALLLVAPVLADNAATAAEPRLVVYAESNDVDSRVVESGGNRTIEGYASELVRSVLAEAGYRADIRVVPWARLMQFLQTEPNVLAFNMTRTPGREDLFQWIGEIRPVSFKLWGLRERIDELPRTLAEARHSRVSSFHNDAAEQYLLSKGFSNLVYVSENYDGLNMLRRGRIDLIPFSEIGMRHLMAQSADAEDALVPVMDLYEISTAHYLVMSKDSDPGLAEQLREAFQSHIDRGDNEAILGPSYR